MQLFLADCQFPDIANQVKAYQLFVEAWENGEMAKSDKTDKFEMLFRVHAPGEGRVVCLCKAESCLLYTSPSPRDLDLSRMPSSA